MKTLVMSGEYPDYCGELKKRGYRVVETSKAQELLEPEQSHADMQILRVKSTVFALNSRAQLIDSLRSLHPELSYVFCTKSAEREYPKNVLLNALLLNNKLYGRLDSLSEELLNFCSMEQVETVNVKQGYANCSTLSVSDSAAITADTGIADALRKDGIDVLEISPGNVRLKGFDYGFIGGAGGRLSKNLLAFFGNIKDHPDYLKIERFIFEHNARVEIIGKDNPLTDIGGIVVL